MSRSRRIVRAVTSVLFLSAVAAATARLVLAAPEPSAKAFRADAIEPGRTTVAQLHSLLGKPMRRVPESARHEYYFYSLGEGSTMDATVSVRSGVVEYVSYLCDDSISSVKTRFAGEPSVSRTLPSAEAGYSGELAQLLYDSKGRGFVYEPKTYKVRACVSWEPGKKFEDLGR